MNPHARAAFWLLLAYLLYFHGLGSVGLLGPDEPRYAQVAREMLRSGDYITPHLNGRPWFEKPPLYYWLAALSFGVFGVTEFAARLPAALAGAAFLLLFAWWARRLFRGETALYAALVLGSTIGWIGFSRGASPEILFTSALAGALGALGVWVWQGRDSLLYTFYALLAVAVLAKGLGAIVLSALVLLTYCIAVREFRWLWRVLSPGPVALFLFLALPWFVAVYWRNGDLFVEDFIFKHHLRRYTTGELAHPGPWWYYGPVLLGGVFPWTPHLALIAADLWRLGRRGLAMDHRRVFLLAWVLPIVVFFSFSQAKLPGYVLVTAPALALWIGNELARAPERRVRWVAAAQAVLLPLVAIAAEAVPRALATGLRSAMLSPLALDPLLAVILMAGSLLLTLLAWRGRRLGAALLGAVLTAIALVRIIAVVAPAADRLASARPLALDIQSRGIAPARLGLAPGVRRHIVYGLEFYLDHPMRTDSGAEFVVTPDGEVQSRKSR